MPHPVGFLMHYGYALLFVWLLAEQGALPLPSIPLLLACGALVRTGQMQLVGILLSGMSACLIADNVWFQLGRRRGGKILRFLCRVALVPDSCVRQTEDTFARYGVNALLVSKFVPGLNAIAAPLAGSAGASRTRFLLFDTFGALLWLSSYLALGYMFSNQIEEVGGYAMRMGSGLIVLALTLLLGWVAWKYIQRQRFLRTLAVGRITPEEVQLKLAAGEDLVILDLRSERESVEDAIHGALRISSADLEAQQATIPRDRDVILFCS